MGVAACHAPQVDFARVRWPDMCFTVLILLVLIVGCGDSSPTVAPNVTPQQQSVAPQSMGIAFPPSTRFLFFDHIQSMDDAIWLGLGVRPVLANFPHYGGRSTGLDTYYRPDPRATPSNADRPDW